MSIHFVLKLVVGGLSSFSPISVAYQALSMKFPVIAEVLIDSNQFPAVATLAVSIYKDRGLDIWIAS